MGTIFVNIILFYVLVFAASAAACAALTGVVRRVALRRGWVDAPNARAVHKQPTPRVGGIAIALSALLVTAAGAVVLGWAGRLTGEQLWKLGVALAAAGMLFLLGVIDDVRKGGVPSKVKAVAIGSAAFAVSLAALPHVFERAAGETGEVSLAAMLLPWAIVLLATLLISAATIGINFIDGLDGLAAGVSGMILLASGAASLVNLAGGSSGVALLAAAAAGAAGGFLVHNRHPAGIFMGDGGSMFLGFAGGTALLNVWVGYPGPATLVAVGLIASVPLLDLYFTLVRRRVLLRRSLWAAERGHVHHRLLDNGLSHPAAVRLIWAVAGATVSVGFVVATSRQLMPDEVRLPMMLAIAAVVFVAWFFYACGSLRPMELLHALRRNRGHRRHSTSLRRNLEEMQLRFRHVTNFDEWWQAVSQAAAGFGFQCLDMTVPARDGPARLRHWSADGGTADCTGGGAARGDHTSLTELRLRHRRPGPPLVLRVRGSDDDGLEGFGLRVTLFARLIEENPISRLPRSLLKPSAAAPERAADKTNDAAGEAGPLTRGLRVAVVHDFLYTHAGAEKVLEQILAVYPQAEVFSLFDFVQKDQRGFLGDRKVTTSFIQRLPFASTRHRAYLPLMPLAIEQLDVSGFDLVISSSYVVAKGVMTGPNQLHVCYCHSPVRFAWDLQHQYLRESKLGYGPKAMLARLVLHKLRTWDARTAGAVDAFITNSDFVGGRVAKYYNEKASQTIHPPVDTVKYSLEAEKYDFYVTLSRMVPYKRVDLIVEAFSRTPERQLVVIGDGPEMEKIRRLAGPNVRVLGHLPDEAVRAYLQRARAFVFAAEEDFGIAPVEAMACGTPVIAYGRGGVTESVVQNETGVFFEEQTVESLLEAVRHFESMCRAEPMLPASIRRHAERFAAVEFRRKLSAAVERAWATFPRHRARTPKLNEDALNEDSLLDFYDGEPDLRAGGLGLPGHADAPAHANGDGKSNGHADHNGHVYVNGHAKNA